MTRSNDSTATDPNKVDAIKLSLMLSELRLPTINQLWQSFAKRADAEGWPARAASSPRSPSTSSPNATEGASSAISRKPACSPARASPPSTSMSCQRSPRPRSWRSPPATHG